MLQSKDVIIIILLLGIGGGLFWQQQQQHKIMEEKFSIQEAYNTKEEAVVRNLQKSITEYANNNIQETQKLARKLIKDLKPIIKDDVSPLEAALMLSRLTDPRLRYQVASILGRLGGQEAEERLLEIAEKDSDTSARSGALQALRQMKSTKAIVIVMKQLKKGSVRDKYAASSALQGLIGPEDVPDLLKILSNCKGSNSQLKYTRMNIYNALGTLQDNRACKVLAIAAKNETEKYVSRAALTSLAKCAGRKELKILGNALKSLGKSGKNPGSSSWSSILQKLGSFNDLRASEYIIPYLNSKNSYVQRTAIQAIGRLQDPLAAKALTSLVVGDAYNKRELTRIIKDYPGLKLDVATKKYIVVDQEDMAKLMEARKARIKVAVTAAKQANNADANAVEIF